MYGDLQLYKDPHFVLFYGAVTALAVIASVYLLFRRGNAFAPEVTPPLRLRRLVAVFFAFVALSHVWFNVHNTTYNAYINNLRIQHFIRLYRKAVATKRSFTAQQLARESGFRSYSTFGTAFKQLMGVTVTAWMREVGKPET